MQRNAITAAKSATPSIRAAATIMFVNSLFITSGVHSLTTDFTNTKTCANSCETCANCGA